MDLVAASEFLLDCDINPEDLLLGFHHFCHLLQNRFDRSAVSAPV
jgi:hypothetical protein